MEIQCPRCNRKVKLVECVCKEKGRKRIMLSFPCYHFDSLVYNVPCSTDNNTIIKDFLSLIAEKHFDKNKYISFRYGDRYL